MAFSLIAHTFAQATNNPTTAGINTTAANLIVLGLVTLHSTGPFSPHDSNSNIWTGLTQQTSGNADARLYYCQAPTVGSGHTFDIPGSSVFGGIFVQAWSGSKSNPFDQQSGSIANADNVAPGAVTPSESNELLVTLGLANAVNMGGTPSIFNETYTITDAYDNTGNLPAAMAYLVQTAAAGSNPTWSWNAVSDLAAVIATFKAAPAGAEIPAFNVGCAAPMRRPEMQGY